MMEKKSAVLMSADNTSLDENDPVAVALETERIARQRLALHPHFRGRSVQIIIRYENDGLTLSGRLPSFYLKQLVQEAIRDLTPRIQNDIEVICCNGFSSTHSSVPYE